MQLRAYPILSDVVNDVFAITRLLTKESAEHAHFCTNGKVFEEFVVGTHLTVSTYAAFVPMLVKVIGGIALTL